MNNDTTQNNDVELRGEIISKPAYNHEVFGEKFYIASIKVVRRSGVEDVIPVLISNRLIDIEELQEGMEVGVIGQYRSYNKKREDGGSSLALSVFADTLFLEDFRGIKDNLIHLVGYLCKRPIHRSTPAGKEIADLLLAVNRTYGKSDYIPCICWGRNAQYVSKFPVGTKIKLSGRIQSRNYVKHLEDGSEEIRTAYEVSAQGVEAIENED